MTYWKMISTKYVDCLQTFYTPNAKMKHRFSVFVRVRINLPPAVRDREICNVLVEVVKACSGGILQSNLVALREY